MLLTNILETNAQKYPNKTACIMHMGFRVVKLSYRQMYELAQKIALLLEQEGVGQGDNVLICAPNSPYWIAVFWGIVLRGARVVPLTTQSTPDMIKRFAQHTQAKVFFTSMALRGAPFDTSGRAPNKEQEKNQEVLPKTFIIETIQDTVAKFDSKNFRYNSITIKEDDCAQILYTSGTTGDPKGVMLSHRNMLYDLHAMLEFFPTPSRHDISLSILPLSHIFEQVGGFLAGYFRCIPIVYAHSPAALRQLMLEYRITLMMVVPEFLKVLMSKIEAEVDNTNKRKQFDRLMAVALKCPWNPIRRLLFRPILKKLGGRLWLLVSGGAPLDPELEKKWSAMGIVTLQGYGLSETAAGVSSETPTMRRSGSVGKVIPGVQVKIAEDGEILVKGQNVFLGYYQDPEKTEKAFTPDGWFCTGDIGYFDQDGFLFLKGRKKYKIIGPGGQNVFPEDIETELNKIAGVLDSTVLGIEQDHRGTVDIHAVLLLKPEILGSPNLSEKIIKIIEEANSHLASYQHITGWTVWPEQDFPRSATRKVKKELVLNYIKEQSAEKAGLHAERTELPKVRTQLVMLLAQITGVDSAHINQETKIIPDLKIDSLFRIELVARIEEVYGVTIDEHDIRSQTTVADLEKIIAAGSKIVALPPLRQWPFSWWASALRVIGQSLVYVIGKICLNVKVEGLEHLHELKKHDGPVIFMPNHVSNLDGLIVANALPWHIRKRLAYAAAVDVLYEDPRYKKFTKISELFFNAFPFPRREEENIKRGLVYMGQILDKNYDVVMFPEGKISLDGRLQKFKQGSGLVAIEMDVPVVPIKISGIETVIGHDDFLPHSRGSITVKIGKPVKFSRSHKYAQVTEKLEEILRDL